MTAIISPPNSTQEEITQHLETLATNKNAWVNLPRSRKLSYLNECRRSAGRLWKRWVDACCLAKGIPPEHPLAGEEWMAGPLVINRALRLYSELLSRGVPSPPSAWSKRGTQGWKAHVFPGSILERMLYLGIHAEVWTADKGQGKLFRDSSKTDGRICLVLGAGNVSSICVTDILHKLFIEHQTVLLKMSPVNAYLGSLIEELFYPLVKDGYLKVIYGGKEEGQSALHHPLVDTVHITGSRETFEAIVWGDDPSQREKRKSQNDPILKKPITSELGCITPILVVPGPWTNSQLSYQARHIAGMVSNNGGFNCVAGQLLVTSKSWAARDKFLAHIRRQLQNLPTRKAYYPGALSRHSAFLEHYTQAEQLTNPSSPHEIPWTFIPDIPPIPGEFAFNNEAFCGLLTETALESHDAASFIAKATEFVNRLVWGDLSCVILIHPETLSIHHRSFKSALESLQYRTIGVNIWTGIGFGLMSVPWGGKPENTVYNCGSGIGWVHNTYLLDTPLKTILKGPFHTYYLPPWFPNNRNALEIGRKLTAFEESPTFKGTASALISVLKAGPVF